ncbi:hypothetical protein BRYFOR_06673 [Marvinbryantia formatexigens DSM 14469]|uniref:Uncharacterized protein n=2 Tax=Marvinbryantia TaxID=248744 RepID=C6LD15_9FIRM|nr:hypothetical protein [Marvinbryantia formatexigens]EET61498.1 hypothetical protein BRYFOR_06673 [Marvinbryantia formatexigens DSM 14469]SDF92746.1 hypothetical protein SAMN05660368_01608 [Marvinbryantia formatexigens]
MYTNHPLFLNAFYRLRKKGRQILGLHLLMMCSVIYYITTVKNEFFMTVKLHLSIADNFALLEAVDKRSLLILSAFFLSLLITCDEREQVQVILRCQSRKKIWDMDCCRCLILACFTALTATATVWLAGLCSGQAQMDWTEEKNILWYITGQRIKKEISLLVVAVAFFVSIAISCFLLGMLLMFIGYIYRNPALGCLIAGGWCVTEYECGGPILNTLSFSHTFWTAPDMKWLYITTVCCFAFYIAGCLIIRRKDFY